MDKKFSKDDIYNKLCEILEEEFEIEKSLLNKDANLFTDLDLDSVDAVDLAVRLQQFTDKRISPDKFKQIRTSKNKAQVGFPSDNIPCVAHRSQENNKYKIPWREDNGSSIFINSIFLDSVLCCSSLG